MGEFGGYGTSTDESIEGSVNNRTKNFAVDMAMLSGKADLRNSLADEALPQGQETVFGYTDGDFQPVVPQGDIDGDGLVDYAELDAETNTVSIWLGGSDPSVDSPDLVRQADFNPDFTDQGLVKEVSHEDLINTDTFIYRVSNGQLFSSRNGLLGGETEQVDIGDVSNTTDTSIHYRQIIRGPRKTIYDQEDIEIWQAKTNVNEELRGWQADHIRTGEQLKVIMINRATGYIGSSIATYGEETEQGGIISFTPEKIHMQPPNLKITVERKTAIEAGIDKGSDKTYTIGFEGTGLTSDKYIVITTEWFDHDGSPLPEDLPGYTGRLAKVVEVNKLGQASGRIANFPIRPGRNMVVVQLPQEEFDTAHYYIHVNGEAMEGNPDFSSDADFTTTGAGDGLLQYRPKHYVPVQVPLHDKELTETAEKVWQQAIADGADPDVLPEVNPVYQWAYRPEMQFTLMDLNVQEVVTTMAGGTVLIDVLNSDNPFINSSEDDALGLFYSLVGPELPMLESFSQEKELVFGLGLEEIKAVPGEDNLTEFSALELLSNLDASGLVALQLYQKGDEANILWELEALVIEMSISTASPLLGSDDGNPATDDTTEYGVSTNGFGLGRHKFQNTFDEVVDASVNYVDDYKIVEIFSNKDVQVDLLVQLLDHNEELASTLINESGIYLQDKRFSIDYEQINSLGIGDESSSADFFIQITITETEHPENKAVSGAIPGKVGETFQGDSLGQLIVHDVKIQDGQLAISRKDIETKGRGPQFSFSRSYNNQTQRRVTSILGAGWRHSYDMVLSPISSRMYNSSPLPGFIVANRGKLFDADAIPTEENKFNWDAVQVNGTLFRRTQGEWVPERGRHGTLEQLDQNWVYTSKDGTKYIYGTKRPYRASFAQRLLESITDRNGNTMTLQYSKLGLLETITDSVGRTFTFVYEDKGLGSFGMNKRLAGITGPDNIEVSFAYDENGLLSAVTQDNRTETYTYEQEQTFWGPIQKVYGSGADYNLASVTDANNHTTNYDYFEYGEIDKTFFSFIEGIKDWEVVKTVTYPDLNTADFSISFLNGNQRIVNDLLGNDTVYTLNYYGNPIKIEEPESRITQMTWSIDEGKDDLVMTSKTDPRGNVITYQYDNNGNITSESTPTGTITSSWNEYSQPLGRTDRNGVSQSWSYDANGNLVQYTDGDNNKTYYSHYSTGEVQTKTDGRGKVTSFDYDDYGNPATVTGAEGSITSFDYDVRGRKVAETDPNGNTTTYSYDTFGNLLSLTMPEIALPAGSNRSKTYSYDAVGNLLSETDHLGLALTYAYTDRDQVEKITRNIGGAQSFTYDANGNLLTETDWKGVETKHTYDKLNQRKSTTNRLGHTMSMDYDLAGNLTQTTDYNGNVTNNEYDALNRLTDTYGPELDGVRGHIVYTYYDEADSKTNLKSVTDQEGNTTSYQYNGRYLKIGETDGNTNSRSWTYDEAGNLETETDKNGFITTHTYDGQNRLVSTEKEGITVSYQYDSAGNRTHVTDGRGFTTQTDYDNWNRPYKVTDALNHVTRMELDGAGNPVKTVDANNVARSASYDKRGLQISATDGENKTTTSTYDLNGNLEQLVDPRGMITVNTYDAEDQVLTTTEAQGDGAERVSAVLSRDKNGNPLQVKDYNGNITTTEYNGLNLVSKVIDAQGKTTSTDYYLTGLVKSVTDRRGHTTSYTYDGIGQQTGITDAKGQIISTAYDANGNVKTVTDKRGIITENFYDAHNRLTSTVKAGVTLVTNEYDDNSNVIATIDANSNRTGMVYDELNRLVKTTFADTTSVTNTYDNLTNILTFTDEEGKVTSNTYDKENRLLTTTLAGETVTNTYDARGNLLSVTRPRGNGKAMAYDLLNRLTSVTDDTLVTRYEYDDNSNLLHLYDPLGNHVEYQYDSLGRKTHHIQHKASGNLTVSMAYDEEGNLAALTDAKGQVFNYTYDELNRQVMAAYPDTATPYLAIRSIETGYDANNNVLSVTETKTGTESIVDTTINVYNDFDRLTSTTQRGVSIGYAYDNNGNRTLVSSANGSTSYAFDKRNRLVTAVADSGTTTYAYTPDSKQETITYPNNAKVEYTYYPTNRVKDVVNSVGGTIISSYAYTYDQNGNRTEQVAVQDGATITTTYSYNSLDQMTGYSESTGNMATYTFEGYNRKTENITKDGTTKNRTYFYDETNWLTQIDDTSPSNPHVIDYAYDNNGNTIRKTVSTKPEEELNFSYDSRDQLVQTTRGPPESRTVLGRYDYNAQGLRVRHLDSARGDVHYFYDDKAVLEEQRSDGGLLAHYRYGSKLLSLSDGSSSQFYHYDGLGSTVNLTDDLGAIQVSYTLDPWGTIDKQSGDSINRQIFTGQEHDENTGLIYFGARFYDPDIARFITQDSYLGEQGTPPSLHRYLYAYSNPTVWVDLFGYAAYFFAGTGNHPEEEVGYDGKLEANYKTNVEKLYEAIEGEKFYAYGIGSGYTADGIPYKKGSEREIRIEGITGKSMDLRVEFMLGNLESQLEKGDKVVDVFGFSRGGASSVDFLNRIQDQIDEGNPLYEDVEIRFVGLFDVVPSKRSSLINYSNANRYFRKGQYIQKKDFRFNLPQKMVFTNIPIHLVSLDEQRKEFAVKDLRRAKQIGFRGVHSDVGGGYKNNNFDWLTRDYMVEEARKAGLIFKQDILDKYSRTGESDYIKWLESGESLVLRSPVKPTDNSQLYYNDNEERRLPKYMSLHPSVAFFKEPPENDISKYNFKANILNYSTFRDDKILDPTSFNNYK